MTDKISSLPSFTTLFRQQLFVVTSGLRLEAMALAAVLIMLCLFAAIGGFGRDPLVAEPSFLIFALPVAALMPIAVWRGEEIFGRSYLWSLPARRHISAIARVAAGALWLITAMTAALLVLWLIALASGGQMGTTEIRLVSSKAELIGAVEKSWSTPSWEYLAPYTAALVVYFASSAALLGLRHPMRWLFGAVLGTSILIAFILRAVPDTPLAVGLEALRYHFWLGDYGLSHALTAGNDGLVNEVELPNGQAQTIWSELPSMTLWLRAIAAWMVFVLSLLSISIWRHSER